MFYKIYSISLRFIAVFFITSCAENIIPDKPTAIVASPSSCHIFFDAGSSGTRLFIYEKQGSDWIVHRGSSKLPALADPVRQINGRKNSDSDAITTEIVSGLDTIKQQTFDWTKQCLLVSATVNATAGMRIAEQEDPSKAKELWQSLRQKLQTKVGSSVTVSTRTITGYEEGLYAWLAVKEQTKNTDFGIVEMGGASTQIAFPCAKCDLGDDANKPVIVDSSPVQIYSYSFLGLGKNEAPKTLGMPETCAYGVGTASPDWKVSDCANFLEISFDRGIRDPYDYNGDQKGLFRQIPRDQARVNNWYLTGEFVDLKKDQINNCCVNKGSCKDAKTSCFRAVYFNKYLQALNVPAASEKLDINWTLGAIICALDNCLQKAKPPACAWLKTGCL